MRPTTSDPPAPRTAQRIGEHPVQRSTQSWRPAQEKRNQTPTTRLLVSPASASLRKPRQNARVEMLYLAHQPSLGSQAYLATRLEPWRRQGNLRPSFATYSRTQPGAPTQPFKWNGGLYSSWRSYPLCRLVLLRLRFFRAQLYLECRAWVCRCLGS